MYIYIYTHYILYYMYTTHKCKVFDEVVLRGLCVEAPVMNAQIINTMLYSGLYPLMAQTTRASLPRGPAGLTSFSAPDPPSSEGPGRPRAWCAL